MPYNGLWHASFTVSNLEASIDFYCGLLGMELYHQQVQHNEYTSKLVGYPDAHLKVAMLRIPNAFVVGSGLDHDGLGRNLPGILRIVQN